ncbi:uncharacterized protein A4U43_C01F13750 [Asparagus officinalis]|uniref:Uncharacterized protein n=1 Tax=Asparagus officinalis TaxID=4686 RepID=A0A5P1FPR5_ASPOF|nr:uncharacterized protein LOC109822714 isoform X1 [Asparagus officinalis]ONK79417.1 uncharacterized protein A4U43_C01F6140 [Asparagus officinalis]ONK80086.1 uncharacterized protein A4U43_C01F13750 [Asparagus officinalis]
MESYMSRSLKSFWGSLELRATPSPKRKKTAMILSAIFAKHAGQIVPSMMPERTRLQRCFSARKTEFTASWKCWIQRVIADSKTSHSILSISSESERRRRWRDSTSAKLSRTKRAGETARLMRERSAFAAICWVCRGATASDAAATVSRPKERRLSPAARFLFSSEDSARTARRLDWAFWSFNRMASSS